MALGEPEDGCERGAITVSLYFIMIQRGGGQAATASLQRLVCSRGSRRHQPPPPNYSLLPVPSQRQPLKQVVSFDTTLHSWPLSWRPLSAGSFCGPNKASGTPLRVCVCSNPPIDAWSSALGGKSICACQLRPDLLPVCDEETSPTGTLQTPLFFSFLSPPAVLGLPSQKGTFPLWFPDDLNTQRIRFPPSQRQISYLKKRSKEFERPAGSGARLAKRGCEQSIRCSGVSGSGTFTWGTICINSPAELANWTQA